jgi:hypothetical protein
MSKYSIEKMHEPKGGRRSGKTVDAVADIIGKIMVTENTVFPFVIKWMQRSQHITQTFEDLCRNHFNVKPIRDRRYTLEIEGYSSKAVFHTIEDWEDRASMMYPPNIFPTFDLY